MHPGSSSIMEDADEFDDAAEDEESEGVHRTGRGVEGAEAKERYKADRKWQHRQTKKDVWNRPGRRST